MKKMNMVLAISLLIMAIPFVLANPNNVTDETINTTLTVNAVPYFTAGPTLEDNVLAPADELDLFPNTQTTVWCNGTADDQNGFADLVSVSGVLYHESSTAGAADDALNHYTAADCDVSLAVDGTFSCAFDLEFYALNGTWTCDVNVTDTASQSNVSNDTSAVTQLLAIDVDNGDIDFGSLAMGTNTTTTDYTKTVTNQGNIQIDLQLDAWSDFAAPDANDANAMDCTSGSLGVDWLRYSLAATTNYDSKTSLVQAGAVSETSFDLAAGAASSRSVYFGIGVPTSGLGGSCTGVLSFTGIVNS